MAKNPTDKAGLIGRYMHNFTANFCGDFTIFVTDRELKADATLVVIMDTDA